MSNQIELKSVPVSEFDVIFLSYDEPNAEENWADLLEKVPWAQRVHGVKGFDQAHKECANKSGTDNFITIDGDNKIDAEFFDHAIDYNPHCVYSWKGKNYVNGLIYGNGGIKLWPKHLVLNMRTHEKLEDEGGVEFCWDLPYYQMHDCYSVSYNNSTSYQAFRVGFREGVKLSLHEGKKVDTLDKIWIGNKKRLLIWMTIGADVENGIYSVFGSRLGCYLTNLTDFNISLIADYDWFEDKWHNEWMPLIEDEEKFSFEYNRLKEEIRDNLDLPIVNFGANQSRFYKETLTQPQKFGLTVTEKEVNELYRNKKKKKNG